jgi:amino acid transporter
MDDDTGSSEGVENDDDHLAVLGYTAELPRQLSTVSLFGMAFVTLNTWSVLSATLSLSLGSGGPATAVWGILIVGFCNLCLAASLAEFLSAYPTAGGQYFWVAVIAPKDYSALLAWISGWLTVFGWIAVAASAALMVSQLALGVVYIGSEHAPSQWEQLLVYICATLVGFASNYWLSSALRVLNKAALTWSLFGFIAIPVLALFFRVRDLADPKFVFEYVINRSGWPGKYGQNGPKDSRALTGVTRWHCLFTGTSTSCRGIERI